MLAFLNGKKTYCISGLIVLLSVFYAVGIIDAETFTKLFAILAGLGGITLRDAIKKGEV